MTDTYNYRVQIFKSDGTYLSQFGTYGKGNGQFELPSGIAVDASGYVYVADQSNACIQKFSRTGKFLKKIGTGMFTSVSGIEVAGSRIYALDPLENRVIRFNTDGSYISSAGGTGDATDEFNGAWGIGKDASGNLYVADTQNSRLMRRRAVLGITYNLQYGSKTVAAQALCGLLISKPDDPVRGGYAFGGWYKDAACLEAWNFGANKATSNMTLYAKWTARTYTVTFNSGNGSAVSPVTAAYNALIAKPANPTRNGYIFGGWYKDSAYAAAWSFSKDRVTADTTLYARWYTDKVYTISTYTSSFGTITGAGKYNGGMRATLTAKPKSGYRFVRWLENGVQVSTHSSYSFTVTKNRKLQAQFAKS